MDEPTDEVAWALMDFEVDTSTSRERQKVIVAYLVDQALKNKARLHTETPESPDEPSDLIGSLYL